MMNFPDFPSDTDLIFEHGSPFIQKGRRTYAINYTFWAACVMKRYGLEYYHALDGGRWFLFDDGKWIPISQIKVLDMIEETLRDGMRQYGIMLQNELDIATIRVLHIIQKKRDKGRPLAIPPDVIPVRDGILTWDSEKADFVYEPYSITKDAFVTTLDVAYRPEERSDFFLAKIKEILPNEEDRRVLQEYMGACLFSRNPSRKVLLLQGEGGSGKSRLPILLSKILTPERVFELDVTALRKSYELSSLERQTLFTAPEAIADIFCKTSGIEFLKKISGGDFFETRQKWCNGKISHWGEYSVIIMTNHPLRFRYDGKGDEFKDRILPILFDQHVPEERQDRELSQRFESERDAIFNWFLDGARQVRRNNWKISLTAEQIVRRDRMVEASKGVDFFVRDFIKPRAGQNFSSQAAYSTYTRYSKTYGFEFLTDLEFKKRLAICMAEQYGATPKNTLKKGHQRGYKNYEIIVPSTKLGEIE